jgi:hypothetical protein
MNKKLQAELTKPSCQGFTLRISVGIKNFLISLLRTSLGAHTEYERNKILLYIEKSTRRHNPEDLHNHSL